MVLSPAAAAWLAIAQEAGEHRGREAGATEDYSTNWSSPGTLVGVTIISFPVSGSALHGDIRHLAELNATSGVSFLVFRLGVGTTLVPGLRNPPWKPKRRGGILGGFGVVRSNSREVHSPSGLQFDIALVVEKRYWYH